MPDYNLDESVPDREILSDKVKANKNGDHVRYNSFYENASMNFVYPKSYKKDFETAVYYYEAVSNCASTGDVYFASVKDYVSKIDTDFGIEEYSVDISDVETKTGEISSKSSDIALALLGNYIVFGAAVEQTVYSITQIRSFIEKNLDEYQDLIVDGDLVFENNEVMKKIMIESGFDVDIIDRICSEEMDAGTSLLSEYIKNFVANNFNVALAGSSVDAVMNWTETENVYAALATGISSYIAFNVGEKVEQIGSGVATKYGSDELTKIIGICCGNTASAVVSGISNYAIKRFILDEDWTNEDTVKTFITGLETVIVGSLVSAAPETAGISLIPAAATALLTTVTGIFIHDWYYTDGIPAYFDSYSIKNHLASGGTEITTLSINGNQCVPEIAIPVLKSSGLGDKEAAFFVGMLANDSNYYSFLFDENGNYTDDYILYTTAYYNSMNGVSCSDARIVAEAVKNVEYADKLVDLMEKFNSILSGENGVTVSCFTQETSAKDEYTKYRNRGN